MKTEPVEGWNMAGFVDIFNSFSLWWTHERTNKFLANPLPTLASLHR